MFRKLSGTNASSLKNDVTWKHYTLWCICIINI